MTVPSTAAILGRLAARWNDEVSYTRRPVEWVAERAKERTWSQQDRILESIRDNRYTAVHAAHELGKSFIASRAIAWWIDSHPPGEAFVISTAPTAAQVSSILWREIGKTHTRASLPGRINRAGYPQWYIGSELVGYGRKPADYEESAFQGIHARYVLVVIDESGGVAKHLFDAIDSIVANENSRVLAIGNPDDPASHFAAVCKPGSDWTVIHLDGLRSPNMTVDKIVGPDPNRPRYPLTLALMAAEGIEFSTEAVPHSLREMLLDPLWVEERIVRWAGINRELAESLPPHELAELIRTRTAGSALFQAKVRGIFPSHGSEGVIPLGWIQQAVNRHDDWTFDGADTSKVDDPTRHIVGIDVARFGTDETVFAERFGSTVLPLHRLRATDTVETADEACRYLNTTGALAVVDVIGIGAGVYDTLKRYRADGRIIATAMPFNASAATWRRDTLTGSFRFANDRAAAWWRFRELLDPARGSKLRLPNDERLIEELAAVKFKLLSGGIIQIESKDDIRKRLGRSTDSADAVIQAFWPEGGQPIDEAYPYDEAPTSVAGRRESAVIPYASQTLEEMIAAGESFGVGEIGHEPTWGGYSGIPDRNFGLHSY